MIFSYQRSLPTASLRLNGLKRETLKVIVGSVAVISSVFEFCDTAICADMENGVPAQLFE